MQSFVKIKPSQNGEITLSFTDIGKSCPSREFLMAQICLLMLFAKIKFSRKFPDLQYIPWTNLTLLYVGLWKVPLVLKESMYCIVTRDRIFYRNGSQNKHIRIYGFFVMSACTEILILPNIRVLLGLTFPQPQSRYLSEIMLLQRCIETCGHFYLYYFSAC